MQEHLPAGTTLIEGSVQTQASSFELADGVLTLYFPPGVNPGETTYDVFGYLPGQYRTLPASVRSAYEPGRYHLGQAGRASASAPPASRTRTPTSRRPTSSTPAARPTSTPAGSPRPARRSSRSSAAIPSATTSPRTPPGCSCLISIREGQPRKIVQYFEVVKEKSPELFLSFDQLLAIGTAYRDIKEYERAMIVWRGLIEASYLEDARVGELLRQRGQTLEAMAYLIDLWRSYPETASIESDFFGLSQVFAQAASRAFTDPKLRRELAAAGITRSELLLQSIRMIQIFLAQSPRNPMADEASLALVGRLHRARGFRGRRPAGGPVRRGSIPRSTYLDSFQYSEALADFHLGRYDRAIEVAETIARATYKDAAGADQPSPNKWQAIYILGQIYDARRQPARALEYYRQVADRFTDAAGAIQSYTRKDLKVPEVSVLRPPQRPAVAAAARRRGFRAVGVVAAPPTRPTPAGIAVDYRNIAQVDVKVYPVDLMQLYLTRRNLNGIAGIDLAGITPLVEKTVALGRRGRLRATRPKSIDLPLDQGRGLPRDDPRREPVRVGDRAGLAARDRGPRGDRGGEPSRRSAGPRHRPGRPDQGLRPKVQVKVIGSDNPQFISGETDLRGVFVAEGAQRGRHRVARKGREPVCLLPGHAATSAGSARLPTRMPRRPRSQPAPGQARGGPSATNPSTPTSRCRTRRTR